MKYDFECIPEPSGRNPYRIELPWPPTVNMYWRNIGTRAIISKSGRQYRQAVHVAVLIAGGRRNMLGSLSVKILAYPPDKRRRDIDNILKAPLDALAKCGVYEDDSQICKLSIERMKSTKPGCLWVEITEH